MRCPYCQHTDSRVLESRANEDHTTIRRRRECPACSKRFTTYEKIEMAPLLVVKKDGRREEFSRDKLLRGILKACEKRPIAIESIEQVADSIEREIRTEYDKEVPAASIGEKVMEKLRKLDPVAYVRFASVYRQFRDVESFAQEILRLLDSKTLGGDK
ncbi:transcriptional regulator NrdR [Effusibacillus pohliae]|uniref:transcriptional regulator NrdR n=1 Tax=Effusibacillus pohliae TaxID=232270 RepID=UPI0003620D60|nr:transcriptional regulator NrdR [Effusibacillus pohliae]